MTTPLIEPLNTCDPRPAAAGGATPPRGPDDPNKRAMQALDALCHASAPLVQHLAERRRLTGIDHTAAGGCTVCTDLWRAYQSAKARYDQATKELLG